MSVIQDELLNNLLIPFDDYKRCGVKYIMEKFKNYSSSKASIVIPTYKRSHLIGRAIRSVLNQNYQNFEIVIIDDSPNDETEKVVKSGGAGRQAWAHLVRFATSFSESSL